jgi:hypothetical protein
MRSSPAPYRTKITFWHRCPICKQNWPQFIAHQDQKIRKWTVPCPDCSAKFGIDVVGLLLQIEAPRLEDDELPSEDFSLVTPEVSEEE